VAISGDLFFDFGDDALWKNGGRNKMDLEEAEEYCQ
jgi:hypothetical protein